MTKKTKANELTKLAVSFISLVDRGANGEPFRIIKRHSRDGGADMLDFSKGFASLVQKGAEAPAMALVVVSKAVGLAAATAILKDAGLEHGEMVKKGNAMLFPIGDFDLTDYLDDEDEADESLLFYKIDADFGFAVETSEAQSIRKGFQGYDYTSKSFKDVLATNTAMPMVRIAMSALADTFYNIMDDADSPEAAASEMSNAVKDFDAQVNTVVKSIPVSAFKLEAAIAKAAASEEEAGDEDDDTDEEEEEEDAIKKGGGKGYSDKKKKKPVKKSEASDDSEEEDSEEEEEEEGEGGDGEEDDDADDGKPVQKSDDKLDAILKAVTTVQSEQKAIRKELKTVRKDVDAQAANLKKMDEVLDTEVLGGDTSGDRIQKNDDDDDEGNYISIDTGFGMDPFDEDKDDD